MEGKKKKKRMKASVREGIHPLSSGPKTKPLKRQNGRALSSSTLGDLDAERCKTVEAFFLGQEEDVKIVEKEDEETRRERERESNRLTFLSCSDLQLCVRLVEGI